MRPPVWTASALAAVAILASIVAGIVYFERPTRLTVAVSPSDAEDFNLVNAAAKLLQQRHHDLRFRIVQTDDVSASAAALDAGKADLAVVRADVAMPAKGGTVVLTHKDAGVLIAPAGSDVTKIEDLAGKRVGLLSSRPGDAHILDVDLAQYDVQADKVTVLPLNPRDVAQALIDKKVDAVFAVGPITEGLVPDTIKAVTKAGKGSPVFLPIAEAPAIVQRLPTYEDVEIVKGSFDGSPPRPPDDIHTLGVTYRLVASTDLGEHTIASLTRFLLTQRAALTQLEPSAVRMEAAATAKGAPLPAHPGTAAYIDDKEETFLEQYSDFIYLGAMVLGVAASGLTAIVSRIGASGSARVEDLVAQLLAVLRQVRTETVLTQLDAMDDEVDDIVTAALDERGMRNLDERRVALLNMAVHQARSAIRDRRRDLRRAETEAAGDIPARSYDRAAPSVNAGSGERAAIGL